MQMSKSVEYKNIHIHISFRVKCLMSICVHELRCSIFLRTKQQWLNTLCQLIKLNCVVLSRVVYQFVFLTIQLFLNFKLCTMNFPEFLDLKLLPPFVDVTDIFKTYLLK